MPEIKDHGKVWMRGKPGTSFAVKVDGRVFVPGREEGQSIDYWLEENFLCVDLHDPDRTRGRVGDAPGRGTGLSVGTGIKSIISGIGIDSSDGPVPTNWFPLKSRNESFLPMSTDVLMYSRPWIPSRVGRTISDISVHIESKPGPENGPL